MNKYELRNLIGSDLAKTSGQRLAYPEVYSDENLKVSIWLALNRLPRYEYLKNRSFDTFDFVDEWVEIIYNSINYWMICEEMSSITGMPSIQAMPLHELIGKLADDVVEDFVRE